MVLLRLSTSLEMRSALLSVTLVDLSQSLVSGLLFLSLVLSLSSVTDLLSLYSFSLSHSCSLILIRFLALIRSGVLSRGRVIQ